MSFRIIGLSGSLRKASWTSKLIRAFQTLEPAEVSLEILEIGNLPFINEDLEKDLPESVKNFHNKIDQCDGVLLATPEYNRSYSPVLKNALDWGSRPQGQNRWKKKPAAVVGCTPYTLGAFGAQNHLRQVMMYLDMMTVQQPEFYLGGVANKFDDAGTLTDEATKEKINEVWQALIHLLQLYKK